MTKSIADDWSRVSGPEGLEILSRFLADDKSADAPLSEILEAADSGHYDAGYAGAPDPERIHVTTSCHLMVMAILHRLKGVSAAKTYKDDALRFVRFNCLMQRMLGLERLTLGWPVYGFGAEMLGQTMIYPLDQAPGSDPGVPLLNADTWRDMPRYDPDHPIARLVRDYLLNMGRLGGIEPVAHMPAPYSLAAEIYGQEPLIGALALDPDFVCELLDVIVTRVLTPWCEDLAANVPNVWLEMSDASGSPMFVGPENFLKFVVDPVRRMIDENPWGDRIFVSNYRGDMPPGAASRGRRKNRPANTAISFDSILAAKKLCSPHFLARLEADAAPLEDYVKAATELKMPLYLGIGAVRLDRNSVFDLAAAKVELFESAKERAEAIKQISDVLKDQGQPRSSLSWPGDIYIEDTNAETNIELVQSVLAGVASVK